MPRPSPSTHPRLANSSAARDSSLRPPPQPDGSPVKAQLDRIIRSRTFSGAHRSQLFLRYILDHALAHPTESLKEYSIAVDVFDRDASYDPAINNTVRVEAGRLRSRLLEYYTGEGQADSLLIEIPRGGYRAVIRPNQPANTTPPRSLALPRSKPVTATDPRLHRLWAIPLAFLLGAFVGYRASH